VSQPRRRQCNRQRSRQRSLQGNPAKFLLDNRPANLV
jgi:hypothetical protein